MATGNVVNARKQCEVRPSKQTRLVALRHQSPPIRCHSFRLSVSPIIASLSLRPAPFNPCDPAALFVDGGRCATPSRAVPSCQTGFLERPAASAGLSHYVKSAGADSERHSRVLEPTPRTAHAASRRPEACLSWLEGDGP